MGVLPVHERAAVAWARLTGRRDVVSSQLAERLAERRAARRRLTLVRVAMLAAVGAVVAGLAWLVLASPVLALRSEHVRVVTSGPAADPALVRTALEPWAGTPLARVRIGNLEEAAEAVAGVRSAEVRRAWPNGLAVEVEARVPVAAVRAAGGRLALLDVDAVQVGEPVDDAPAGVPVVSMTPGRNADALGAVLTVLEAVPPELRAEITQAVGGSAETVSFRLSDGSRVEWGSGELSELKARVLAVLRQRPAQVYDVSAPTMPVTR